LKRPLKWGERRSFLRNGRSRWSWDCGSKDNMTDSAEKIERETLKEYRQRSCYPYFSTLQTRWSDNDQYGLQFARGANCRTCQQRSL